MAWSARTRIGTTFAVLALATVVQFAGSLLVVDRPVDTPDAIVSLASHEWERLPLSASLATDNPNAVVILTQPRNVSAYNCHDCGRRLERLEALGIAPHRVRVLLLKQPGTYGEALACRAYVRDHPLKRLLVVTSPYHTRRALAAFRKVFAGTDVALGVTPASAYSPARPSRWWASGYDLWYVSYEWAALPYYLARYGVQPFW